MSRPLSCLPLTRPRGFTLIELLTVIAIIGILAAILIPTVSKVRQSARAAQCVSNMRQMGVGFHLFAEDHKGRMVYNMDEPSRVNGTTARYWPEHVRIYLKKDTFRINQPLPAPFNCPASNYIPSTGGTIHFSNYSRSFHQANEYGKRNNGLKRDLPLFISRMSAPSRVIALMDGQSTLTNPNSDSPREMGASTADRRLATRHGSRVNILYFDWHVAGVNRDELVALSAGYVDESGNLPWEDPG